MQLNILFAGWGTAPNEIDNTMSKTLTMLATLFDPTKKT